jgi:hypothetical protein
MTQTVVPGGAVAAKVRARARWTSALAVVMLLLTCLIANPVSRTPNAWWDVFRYDWGWGLLYASTVIAALSIAATARRTRAKVRMKRSRRPEIAALVTAVSAAVFFYRHKVHPDSTAYNYCWGHWCQGAALLDVGNLWLTWIGLITAVLLSLMAARMLRGVP